jgi:serine protease
MKRRLALLLPLVVAACQDNSMPVSGALAPGGQPAALSLAQRVEQVMPGEVIVKARAGQDVAAIARGHGVEIASVGYGRSFVVVRGATGNERALAARLGADARVEYAEPNYLRQPTSIDPRLWAFFNDGSGRMFFTTGSSKGKPVASKLPVADADEDNVEGYAAGGAAVVIGSIDTGVDLDHPEFLAGQLIAGRDWYNNDASPVDDEGHGTHTTGTMVGRTVGVAGVSGAGANVKVYVQKVCGRRGCPTSAIVSAIRAAADYPGMVAMNLSLGGSSESQAEKDAISYAVNTKGVLVIASAGNDGVATVGCPACDPLSISVAATNWADGLSYYSNWGTGIDIAAPGGEMYSNTSDQGGIYSSVVDGYDYYQGTSMAAPQVTGTAAIVASKTGLRGSALRARLESTADDRGAAGYDNTFGNGRLNSYRAVTNSSLAAGQ